MHYKNIKVSYDDSIAFVTIDRQDVRNALDQQTLLEIKNTFEEFQTNESVHIVVITGAGEKTFASGADIQQLEERKWSDAFHSLMQSTFDFIADFEKPTIAMINGHALGGGCELAMACDIRVASTNVKLGLPELSLGIIPSAGGTQRMTKFIGFGKTMDYILTSKILTAEEALADGLINTIAVPEKLYNVTREKAQKILSKGPIAAMLAKKAIHLSVGTDIKTGLLIERSFQSILFNTEDKKEGVRAFLEKRPAEFKGY